jgi:hypothetical protein
MQHSTKQKLEPANRPNGQSSQVFAYSLLHTADGERRFLARIPERSPSTIGSALEGLSVGVVLSPGLPGTIEAG